MTQINPIIPMEKDRKYQFQKYSNQTSRMSTKVFELLPFLSRKKEKKFHVSLNKAGLLFVTSKSATARLLLASHADVLRLVTQAGARDKPKNVCLGG